MRRRKCIERQDYLEGTPIVKDDSQVREMLRRMERWTSKLEADGMVRHARIVENAVIQAVEHNNMDYCTSIYQLRSDVDWPVDIDEFIESPEFLGEAMTVWPKLRDEMRMMTPDILAGASPVTEVLNRSTIGTGKSEMGKIRMLYDLYFLCCFKHPQLLYSSMNKYMKILIVMQSVRDHITRRVLYEPARQMFTDMPWVRKNVQWDKEKESTLVLSNGVILAPMVASAAHMIGQATLGGHIDEANFMEVVGESKKVAGVAGQGGLYDQAEEVYSTLSRRRRSRFITKGPNPGCIYVSSSLNYQDDFLERRIRAVQQEEPENVKHIHVIDYRQFDVRPDTFSGTKFRFLVGTNEYPPKILHDDSMPGVDYPEIGRIEEVPIEFIDDFRHNPDKAQRDILGIASTAIHRFISQTHKIVQACSAGRDYGIVPFVNLQNVTLSEHGLPQILEANLPEDRDTPRFIHVDLSRSADRCGLSMVRIVGHTNVTIKNLVETLPTFAIELAVSIQPDTLHQIDIADLRQWIMLLKSYYGFNIVCVTYDGFDSQESIQQWRRAGIRSYNISMDRTTEPYDMFKQALYQDRVLMVENHLASTELAQLERHERNGKAKIDHPPKGSKDIADAIVGACFAAASNRAVRSENEVRDTLGRPVHNTRRRGPAKRRRVSRRVI